SAALTSMPITVPSACSDIPIRRPPSPESVTISFGVDIARVVRFDDHAGIRLIRKISSSTPVKSEESIDESVRSGVNLPLRQRPQLDGLGSSRQRVRQVL